MAKTKLMKKGQTNKKWRFYPKGKNRGRSFIDIPKGLVNVDLEEEVIWSRVCAWGKPAERLNQLLEAGVTGIEFSRLGVRDNSFYDESTEEDVPRQDLTCGRVEDILTNMPRGGKKKASSAL